MDQDENKAFLCYPYRQSFFVYMLQRYFFIFSMKRFIYYELFTFFLFFLHKPTYLEHSSSSLEKRTFQSPQISRDSLFKNPFLR